MLKDITLGQYFPGKSVIHLLDPRTKLIMLVVYIVAAVYGLTTVTTFALPMMVGVVVGCYSSLCIAAPLYTLWTVKRVK